MQSSHSSSFAFSNSRFQSNVRVGQGSLLQQKQIQQLQQKVDMILLHNSKLIEQNISLKSLLEEAQTELQKCSQQNYQSYQNGQNLFQDKQISQLKKQLSYQQNNIQCILIQHKNDISRYKQEIQNLNSVIRKLSLQNDNLHLEKQSLQQKLLVVDMGRDQELTMMREQLQGEVLQNGVKKEIEWKEKIQRLERENRKREQQIVQRFQVQKREDQNRWRSVVKNLQENNKNQMKLREKDFACQVQLLKRKIQSQANDKCKKIREQSENYIKVMLKQQEEDQKQNYEELQKQIYGLKQSLESRQKVIQSLLAFNIHTAESGKNSYYEQVQELRKRLQEVTEGYLKEAQILKVKMVNLHNLDIQETTKIYQDRIQFFSERVKFLENQNFRLNERYQQQIHSKLKQRHKFEIDVSKLKNRIRKMKVELENYGKQVRLNIESMKDQANSFSMTVIGELGQQKQRNSFQESQLQKLRDLLTMKQNELEQTVSQNESKVQYFQNKNSKTIKMVEQLKSELQSQNTAHKQQLQNCRTVLLEQLAKTKAFYSEKQTQFWQQKEKLADTVKSFQEKVRELEIQNRHLTKTNEQLQRKLSENNQFIETLRMELQTVGTTQLMKQKNTLKTHYERQITELQNDKIILKQKNEELGEQLALLIGRYKALEGSISKAVDSAKKRTALEEKVIQMGSDNNLVKNMAEIYGNYSK